MSRKELLAELRSAHIINEGAVELRAGQESDIYADVKSTLGNPGLKKKLARLLLRDVPTETTFVAGAGFGGIPLASEVSSLSGLPASYIRGVLKNYGMNKQIEGYTPVKGDYVTLVDDVFSTGSSLLESAEILENAGATVISCQTVVCRGDIGTFRYPLSCLFDIEELM